MSSDLSSSSLPSLDASFAFSSLSSSPPDTSRKSEARFNETTTDSYIRLLKEREAADKRGKTTRYTGCFEAGEGRRKKPKATEGGRPESE